MRVGDGQSAAQDTIRCPHTRLMLAATDVYAYPQDPRWVDLGLPCRVQPAKNSLEHGGTSWCVVALEISYQKCAPRAHLPPSHAFLTPVIAVVSPDWRDDIQGNRISSAVGFWVGAG